MDNESHLVLTGLPSLVQRKGKSQVIGKSLRGIKSIHSPVAVKGYVLVGKDSVGTSPHSRKRSTVRSTFRSRFQPILWDVEFRQSDSSFLRTTVP